METNEKAAFIKEVLENKKGEGVTALDLSSLSSVADSFVIATGISAPHVKALADEVEEKMSEKGFDPLRIEGYDSAVWILLDYGDTVVHIFGSEARGFYALDKLWADAPEAN